MSLYNGIFYGVLFLLGAAAIYFIDLKHSWQQKRISNGLIFTDDDNCPGIFTTCEFLRKKIYILACIRLFFIAFSFSALIMLVFIFLNRNTPLSNIYDYIAVTISMIFIYFAVLGLSSFEKLSDAPMPLEGKIIEDTSRGAITQIVSALNQIKSSWVNRIVSREKRIKENHIKKHINEWVIACYNQNDVKLPVLALRIHEDYLLKLLPEQLEGNTLDEFKDLKLEIVTLYLNKSSTLPDELINFFVKETAKNNIKLITILEFIGSVETASRMFQDKTDVDAQIGSLPKKTNKKPKANKANLDTLREDKCIEELNFVGTELQS